MLYTVLLVIVHRIPIMYRSRRDRRLLELLGQLEKWCSVNLNNFYVCDVCVTNFSSLTVYYIDNLLCYVYIDKVRLTIDIVLQS